MRIKSMFSTLFVIVFFFVSCEEENLPDNSEFSDELSSLVSDEVVSDINFADLLDEGDDGVFWGEEGIMTLKSAAVEYDGTCPAKQFVYEENKKVVTKTYSGDDCNKDGTIVIEYFKPNNGVAKKKTITYINFTKNDITYNGYKHIVKGNGNYNIEGRMEIDKINKSGDSVHVVREFHRQVHWLCGLETPRIKEDNIKKVTGQTDFDKTIDGETKSYTKKILEPLLIVKACDLRIQGGVVKITKPDGAKVKIDYGQMPEEISCDADFECDNSFEVTKDDVTYQVELVDGKRVKVKDGE